MLFNDLSIKKDILPPSIPIFPLNNTLLLPGIELPLNIFEPRYIRMIDDAMAEKKLIGLVQPQQGILPKLNKNRSLNKIGCAGKIRAFNETEDGRYLIVISGVSRFEIQDEISTTRGYRRFAVDWSEYEEDFNIKQARIDYQMEVNRQEVFDKLNQYLKNTESETSLNGIAGLESVEEGFLVDFLSSYISFSSEQKQMLLEAKTIADRAKHLYKILGVNTEGLTYSGSGSNLVH